jgi:hypothetical protein
LCRAKLNHVIKNPAMPVVEKVICLQFLHGRIQRGVIEQDCPEHRALGIGIVRKRWISVRLSRP